MYDLTDHPRHTVSALPTAVARLKGMTSRDQIWILLETPEYT